MGWFDRFVVNMGNIAEDATGADAKIPEAWKKYIDSVPEKVKIVSGVVIDISRLKELLRTELADVNEDKAAEIEIIKDLTALGREHGIRAARRLKQTLDYAERKYEYVFSLVQQIVSIVRREFHLACALERQNSDRAQLIELLQNQIELELVIIKKINDINEKCGSNRFHELFMDLARGEQVIRRLSEREHRLLNKMNTRSNKVAESLLNKWGDRVMEKLEDAVHNAEARGLLGYNPDMDFEFVNQSMFEDFVRELIVAIRQENAKGKRRKGLPSDATINAFIHDFRQWFNQRDLNKE